MKGLPSSYQRDLQEDKEALFAAHDQIAAMVSMAAGAVRATKFNEAKLRAVVANDALLATEAADYFVRRGMPFRQAHDIVGKILREAERQNTKWTQLPLADLKKLSPLFENDFSASLNVEAALQAKAVPGGTARASVQQACDRLEKEITKLGALK